MRSTRHSAAVWAMVCVFMGLWSSGCTLTMNYYQCTTDSDCKASFPNQPYCTPDNICVPDLPIERLCTTTYPAMAPTNPIHLGVLVDLSGVQAGQVGDTVRLNSIELAVNEINDLVSAGDGSPILLHICDASLTQTDLVNSLNLLTQLGAVAVIGPTDNQTMLNLAPVAANLNLPLVSPSVTTSSLTSLATQGYAFTLAPLDVQQTNSMYNELIAQLGIGSDPQSLTGLQIVGIFTQDEYGESVRTAFQMSLANNVANKGIDQPFSFPAGDTSQISETEDSVHRLNGVAAIIMMVSANADTFLKDFNTPGGQYFLNPTAGVQIICSDGCRTDAVLNIATPAIKAGLARVTGVSAVSLQSGNDQALEFLRSYNLAYTDPSQALDLDLYGPYGYDAVYAVGIAAQSLSGTPTGAGVAAALAKIKSTAGQSFPVGRSFYLIAANTLSSTSIALTGVTGPIGFLQTGQRDNPQFTGFNIQVAGANEAIVVGSNACSGGSCDVQCDAGYTECPNDHLCHDLNADVNNCGACGTACAADQSCCQGTCTSGACSNCPSGTNACGTACVNEQTDPNNCGDCGVPCTVPSNATVSCTMGNCGFSCNPPYTACGSGCTLTASDVANCGACGVSCGNGSCCNGVCVKGTCNCPTGQTMCGGVCTNESTDLNNCGACGAACKSGLACCGGSCVVGPCPCPQGQTSCSGTCTNTLSDSNNCGACGMACGVGTACCNGSCVASCTCPAGQTNCGSVCVSELTDPLNCGSCGNVCPVPQHGTATCALGTCGISCSAPYTACGSECTNTATDINNCGTCGNVCAVPGLPVPAGFVNYALSSP